MDWKFEVGDLVVSKTGLQILLDANEMCQIMKSIKFVQFIKWSRIIGREMDECAGGCCQRWYVLENEDGGRAKLHEDSILPRSEANGPAMESFEKVYQMYKSTKEGV